MPEDDDLYDEEPQPEEPSREDPNLRQLRKKAKAHDEALARAEAAERKLVVAEAGLKLSPRQLDALTKVHDGDWTPEALKATAEELGFAAPPAREEPDLSAITRFNEVTAGGDTAPAPDYLEQLRNAATPDEVMAIAQKAGRRTSWDSDGS